MTIQRIALAVGALIAFIVFVSAFGSITENVDANEIMVLQSISGDVSVHTTPGWKSQWWGKVTKYHKRAQFTFDGSDDAAKPIKVRFNDGGHAQVFGSFAWEMPTGVDAIKTLHMKYGSESGIADQLVRTTAERAIYMTGPLMSSTESYAVRRPDLLSFIEDQMRNGVYRTRKNDIKAPDPITGQEKTVSVVELVTDDKGVIARQERSPLSDFGVKAFNLSFKDIRYDEAVEAQIKQQQQMAMNVQTAIAEAKQAEQNRITTEQNGMAEAAKAKWEQEVVKAREVTAAQQRLAVAELDARAAEQTKRKLILEGEGEGAKRRAIMAGDGALDKKLEAWLTAQNAYANALANAKVSWVPSVVTGGSGASVANGQQMLEILAIKAAKDLSLEMRMPKE